MLGMRASSPGQARAACSGADAAPLMRAAAPHRPLSLHQQPKQQQRRRRGPAPVAVERPTVSRRRSTPAVAPPREAEEDVVAPAAAELAAPEAAPQALPAPAEEAEAEDMTEATVTDDAPPEPTAAASAAAARRALPGQQPQAAETSLAQRAVGARDWAVETGFASALGAAAGAGLAATLAVAAYRAWRRASSPRAVRRRVLDRNRALIDALREHLAPDGGGGGRAGLTPAVAARVRARSGFTPVEVFRKFLWYLLRDRRFDGEAVADAAALKAALGLSDEQAAEALRERADRVYEKYGTLMLGAEAQGLSAAGLERKAACRALFAKLLYLAETEAIVGPAAGTGRAGDGGRAVFSAADLRDVFGATEDDVDAVRIASLEEEGAVERLEAMMGRARHAERVMQEAGMAEEEAVDGKWAEDQVRERAAAAAAAAEQKTKEEGGAYGFEDAAAGAAAEEGKGKEEGGGAAPKPAAP